MKVRASNLINAALVVCAIVVTAAVVRQQFLTPGAATPAKPHQVRDWLKVAQEGHRLGPDTAALQLIVFGDYQCPFCATADAVLQPLVNEHPGMISIVHRHFPIESIHPHAFDAALAAECAAAQARFAEFHQSLYGYADSIGHWSWTRFADHAGIPDVATFGDCVQNRAYAEKVSRDKAAGRRLGVQGTPTFIMNGLMFLGSPRNEPLEQFIRRQIPG
jgi:protein-disulfide isomerase